MTICEVCRPDQFKCKDGHCINIKNKCNSWDDCEGGEDEVGCKSTSKSIFFSVWQMSVLSLDYTTIINHQNN